MRGIALCGNPDFLVLDEPINSLDPQGIIEMRKLIMKLNREHQITVLISSHILDELAKLATHHGFIDNGHVIKEIRAEELDAASRKCVSVEVTSVKTFAFSWPWFRVCSWEQIIAMVRYGIN